MGNKKSKTNKTKKKINVFKLVNIYLSHFIVSMVFLVYSVVAIALFELFGVFGDMLVAATATIYIPALVYYFCTKHPNRQKALLNISLINVLYALLASIDEIIMHGKVQYGFLMYFPFAIILAVVFYLLKTTDTQKYLDKLIKGGAILMIVASGIALTCSIL